MSAEDKLQDKISSGKSSKWISSRKVRYEFLWDVISKIDSQQEMWVRLEIKFCSLYSRYECKKCAFHRTSLGKCPHAPVAEWWGEGHTSRCQSPHGCPAQNRCFFQLRGCWSCGRQVCSASAHWTADSRQKTQRASCEMLGWLETRKKERVVGWFPENH